MLAIPDTTVYTPSAAKALLLFSFRHKIPLIGLTEAWVKAGALYALEWDYQELGSYCGALAARALAGPKAPVPPPPRPRVVVNLRIADQFRLKWNAELVQSVDARFE
jgi:putative ABC transport system substrate-binding protein